MTKIIGLDAGHGLKTAGKQTPDGIKEWTLNDKVRDFAVERLSKYDVKIIHCDNDEGNTDESLTSRRNMYVNAKVDAFVSIHHNAFKGVWGSHGGVSVYYDKTPIKGDKELATMIYERMVRNTGLRGRGLNQSDFTVINQNSIPAVLCEGGFMDSTTDKNVIRSTDGQKAYGYAVADGLVEFLGLKLLETSNTKVVNYRIRVANVSKGDVLNIREKPTTNSTIKGKLAYNDNNLYTIVEECGGWGKLKSGLGWISLYYTKKA